MDFLDCKVCNVRYDEEEHRPRNAPCGHELCSACIRALIKDSIFECPKCRQKNKVDVPDDLPVCFGLIDVIRAFKTQNISLPKVAEPKTSDASSDEVCKAHQKMIGHRCLNCQRWACDECLTSHSPLTGCSTISSSTAVSDLKTEHTENIGMLLTIFEDDNNCLLSKIQTHKSKIQEINDKKKELTRQADEHGQEIEKIESVLEQGQEQKKNLVESENNLSATNFPHAVIDRIEVLDKMKFSLRSWSLKNLGTDTLHGLSQALGEGKDVYIEMVFEDQKRHGRLIKLKENIYVSTMQIQTIAEGSMCIPFGRLQKLVPPCPSLVFLELSLGDTVKGRIIVKLDKNLSNIRENIVDIVTGQLGVTLAGIKLNEREDDSLSADDSLPFREMQVTLDRKGTGAAKRGDIVGWYGTGYLQYIFFQVESCDYSSENNDYRVVGTIVSGLDILQECHANHSRGVVITDCGLVLKDEK